MANKSGLEIEKKFVIEKPSILWLESREGVVISEHTQTYLTSEPGWERRVRKTVRNGTASYTETHKSESTWTERMEREWDRTEDEYKKLMQEELPGGATLHKTRYAFPYDGKVIEIDTYPFWENEAVCEIELASPEDSFTLPSDIKVIRDATDDLSLKNRALAKANSERMRLIPSYTVVEGI